MKREALDLWERAAEALRAARVVLSVSGDAAASRAYYAAFYAVSALLAAEGKTFRKHAGVEAAVHGELVRCGRWPAELGAAYTKLLELRQMGDYGGGRRVGAEDARHGIETASRIMTAVSEAYPEDFVPSGPD